MINATMEICCGSAEDVYRAALGGADRAEMCSSLFHGGLSPSLGSLLAVREKTDIPIIAMLRPRQGGFCYTELEFSSMLHDARAFLEAGADGVVFGCLHEDGTVDVERCRRLVELADGKQTVFHRAFDVVPDWREAMDLLIELGVTRILTSGQESNVFFALDTVAEMRRYANGRIQIMPGAGITLKNVRRVLDETGCEQFHLGCYTELSDKSTLNNRGIFYGGALYPSELSYDVVDSDYVRALRQA